jgi:CheY-like chemotaxis protein
MNLSIGSTRRVRGDESELRDVLVNIVFNAVDAMPNGGDLRLSVEDSEDFVVVSVSDSGCGMSADVRSRIFDPFFTTKGKAGMGLGLAVSFGIVRRHEGRFEVESEVGRGSTFRIYLPAVTKTSSSESRSESQTADEIELCETSTTTLSQANILVVDDEQPIRELLRDILKSEGCKVSLAAGGREALALFESEKFHAVFTDVGMPGMSGWELAQAIRKISDVPIAVITGWGDAVASTDQKDAGVNWVITKPFRVDRIAALARELAVNYEALEIPTCITTAA